MKHLIITALCAAMLAGCAQKTESSQIKRFPPVAKPEDLEAEIQAMLK